MRLGTPSWFAENQGYRGKVHASSVYRIDCDICVLDLLIDLPELSRSRHLDKHVCYICITRRCGTMTFMILMSSPDLPFTVFPEDTTRHAARPLASAPQRLVLEELDDFVEVANADPVPWIADVNLFPLCPKLLSKSRLFSQTQTRRNCGIRPGEELCSDTTEMFSRLELLGYARSKRYWTRYRPERRENDDFDDPARRTREV